MNLFRATIFVLMNAVIYAYRSIKAFTPGLILTIFFLISNNKTIGTIIIVFIVLLGGFFYEFKLLDFVRGEDGREQTSNRN